MHPDATKSPFRMLRYGLPWWLVILLIVLAFVSYLVFSAVGARNRGLESTQRLYDGLRSADEAAVLSSVTGYALKQLSELEARFGKVLSYEIESASGLPEDHWVVNIRVVRERAQTTEEVGNVGRGRIIKYVGGVLE